MSPQFRQAALALFGGAGGGVAVAALVVSCASGLSDLDAQRLTKASRLNGMAYAYEDAESPPAAIQRGAYCDTAAVLRDHGLPVPDAGIQCQHQ